MLSVKDTLRMILSRLKILTNRSLELPNYFDPDHTSPTLNDARPTTANIEPNSSASVRHFLSTSSMTTGKPATDGNILHFSWDNSNRWAAQLAMQHGIDGEGLPSPPQFRYQYGEGKDDWTPWETCGYVPTRQYIYKSGSATVNSAKWYDLCSVTLPAQSGTWLILTNVNTNSANAIDIVNSIMVSGAANNIANTTRLRAPNGQGLANWAYIRTKSNVAATITLRSYGYYTTSHTESGSLIAIRL